LPLPDAVVGKPLMKVEISIDRPLLMRNDGRELGAAFGTFVINP
jgi:hypothetical protein